MKDTTQDTDYYAQFYDELGQKFPETAVVHGYRGPNTRYWTVWGELLPFAKRGKTLLDVGCNDGVYTVPFCQNGGQALGIDISQALVKKASDNAARVGVICRFMPADIEREDVLERVGKHFDVVLLSEVLEHLINPQQALRNIHKLLRPAGTLIITVPTPLSAEAPVSVIEYFYRAILGQKLLETCVLDTTKDPALRAAGISAYLWRHDCYYPRALRRYIEAHGFQCIRFYTIGFLHFATKKILSALFDGTVLDRLTNPLPVASSNNSRVVQEADPHPAWLRLKSAYHSMSQACELIQRKIPVVKLMGVTNVGIFRKRG